MSVPTDYIEGYEKARAIDAELADRYVAHTTIGDPEADAVIEEIASLGREEGNRFVHAGMEQDEEVLREAPQLVRDFFQGPGHSAGLGRPRGLHGGRSDVPPELAIGPRRDGRGYPGRRLFDEHREIFLHHGTAA